MRGTNSNTVIAQDVPVTADMTVAPDAKARIDRQLFRVPLTNQITSGGAAVVLGMARAAIDEMAKLSRTRMGPDGMPIAQQPRIQAAFGQAGARVDAASALLRTKLGMLDAAAAAGRPATEAERGAVRGAYSQAAETARAVLTSMYELGSSTALYESSPTTNSTLRSRSGAAFRGSSQSPRRSRIPRQATTPPTDHERQESRKPPAPPITPAQNRR
ncbi:acyl-CoA dehydrogenase family protein [Streptomyces sp900116325]|uniref:acyl-CoA dehydrogenase family protein n=1 Tax=Streptomyces sp. 900116325 TaxID=3154295 RepID=UPI0033BAC8D3